jgi:putative ABC transport system ATP-binding protein
MENGEWRISIHAIDFLISTDRLHSPFFILNYPFSILHLFMLYLIVQPFSMQAIIHLDNIRKNYYLGKQVIEVLKGITLDIHKGEYVALMGPSGSGKSTLMNILGCLDSPSGGRYILNAQDVSKMIDNQLAEVRNQEIGFVFQQFNLLPRLTAAENVALPLVYAGVARKQRMEKALHVLDKVGLADRSHHKPNEMSGGQNQRTAIARALVNDPSIILADEPTGNLDSKTSHEIMDIFGKIHSGGNTVVLVTHEEDIAKHAHRIIRLRDGVIETDKRREEVAAH